ncbi:MAG: hypothetical protein H0X62_08925 [Bacteroidetes bacterium]|nr:hypothetical protein [Bacteroidota bacterium]
MFWQKLIKERGLTFIIVILTGILIFSYTAIERALTLFTGTANESGIMQALINIITAILVFIWFALLFKLLPFSKISWEPTLVGAAVTSLLFFIGV